MISEQTKVVLQNSTIFFSTRKKSTLGHRHRQMKNGMHLNSLIA
jgi:hypothetical protein